MYVLIQIFFQPMDSLEPASSMPSSMPSSASPGICSSDNYDEMNSADSEFQFPWKQREILTFDIPVHDSERAGLGVSVKGKTSTGRGTYQLEAITLRIVGYHFSSWLTATLNLCLIYFKITWPLSILLEHMHKKFEINRTKIRVGCQLGRKVVTHNSKSDCL